MFTFNTMKPLRVRWKAVGLLVFIFFFLFMLYYMYSAQPSCGLAYLTERSMLPIINFYCNPIDQPVTGQEGVDATDANKFQLQSVHVVVRHGDRFHLHSLPNYHYFKLPCAVDENFASSVPVMKDFLRVMKQNEGKRLRDQPFFDLSIYPAKPFCQESDLTPEGATQHVKNGRFLKEQYPGLLDKDDYMKEIMVRCTKKKRRTFQSAVAFMYGFLPEFNIAELNMEVASNNSMCTEKMLHSCHCPNNVLFADVMAANYRQMSPEVRHQAKVKQAFEDMARTLNASVADMPRMSHVFDVNMIHVCHARTLPHASSGDTCASSWAVHDIYHSVQDNGAKQVQTSEYKRVAKLKMQPLLYEIAHRMTQQVNGEIPTKFVLYSGHDTTIEPLAAALGFSKGKWSRYAARIVFELYTSKTQTDTKSAFIRVLYDGVVVTRQISFCQGSITDDKLQLCPLENFREHVDGKYLQLLQDKPTSYEQACSIQ